jgi:hypothetical protein
MSPTQRSLAEMRKRGYTAQVVERWNSFAKIRQDLFGFIDVLCVGNGETVAVQCTSGSNVSSRIKKIAESDDMPTIRKAGWKILVHGWRKNAKGRWVLREVDVS